MIKIKNFHKTLGNKVIHNNVTLSVEKGQTLAVIGASGVGKSVLLKCIAGIMSVDKGEIYVDNVDITKLTPRQWKLMHLKIGYMFQGAALFDNKTIFENVGFALKYHTDLSDDIIARKVEEKLDLVGLKDKMYAMPQELSEGMKKRAGLARALATDPPIVLYDEPTTGLDPIMCDVINDLIVTMQKKLGVTGIVVTHDMESAFRVAHNIALLVAGNVVHFGTPEETKNTDNEYVQQFIRGDSEGPFVSDF